MGAYLQKLDGLFKGVLRWPQWETLIATLLDRNDGAWYVYYIGEDMPRAPLAPERFAHALNEIDGLLRRDHDEDYLGIVYTDDFEQPEMVKVFDPNNLGASCGASGERILPGWIISRLAPEDLGVEQINPAGRRRWWRGLFG